MSLPSFHFALSECRSLCAFLRHALSSCIHCTFEEFICTATISKRQDGSQLLTESGALQLGLGIALEYILDIGVDNIWRQIQFLAGILRDKLRELPGVTVQDKGCLLCGIVSFTLVGVPPSRPLRIVLPSPSHTPHVSITLGAADFRSSATLPTELHVTKAECTLQWQSFGCSDHMLGTCG